MEKSKKLVIFIFLTLSLITFTTSVFAQDTKYISEVKAEGYSEKGKLVWEGDVFVEGNETNIELSMPKNVVEIKIKPVATSECKVQSISLGGQTYTSSDKIKINEAEVNLVIKTSLKTSNNEKDYTLKLKKREISTDANLSQFSYSLRTNNSVIGSGLTDEKIADSNEIVINIPNSISSIYFTTFVNDKKIKNKYINIKIFNSDEKLYEQVNGISEVKYNFGQEKEAKFTVKTTAEDGITSKEYTVKVIKDKISSDTSLSDVITLNTIGVDSDGYDKNIYTLNIETDGNKGNLEAFIPDSEMKLAKKFSLYITVKNPTSKIQIVQNNKNIESYDIESYYITQNDPVYINVTAEDGTKKQYTLKIVNSLFAEKPSENVSNEVSKVVPKVEEKKFDYIYIVLAIVAICVIAALAIVILRKKKQYSHMDLKDFTDKK